MHGRWLASATHGSRACEALHERCMLVETLPAFPALPPNHSPSPHIPPPQVLAAGRVEQLAETFGVGAGLAGGGASVPRAGGEAAGPLCMALDGAALENLEVGV